MKGSTVYKKLSQLYKYNCQFVQIVQINFTGSKTN